MTSKITLVAACSAVLCVAGLSGLRLAHAEPAMDDKMMTMEVTITNVTKGQPLSPPIVVSHSPSMHLFQVGELSSPALQKLAEEGMNGELAKMCEGKATDVKAAGMDDKIMPGKSLTLKIKCKPGDVISVAAMVAASNDTFTGIDGVKMDPMMHSGAAGSGKMEPGDMRDGMKDGMKDGMMDGGMMMKDGMMTGMTMAYDAGTEENTEKKSDTAGPDMGKGHPATSPPQPITVSKGIQGVGDLDKATFGWTGPVAKIEMKKAS